MTSSIHSLWNIRSLPPLFHTRLLYTSHWTTFPDEEIVEGIVYSLVAEGILTRKNHSERIVGAYLGNPLAEMANKAKDYNPECCFFCNPCEEDLELLREYMRFFASSGKELSIGWILTNFLRDSYPLCSYVLMNFVGKNQKNPLITDRYIGDKRVLEITIQDVGYRVEGNVDLEKSKIIFPPLTEQESKILKLKPPEPSPDLLEEREDHPSEILQKYRKEHKNLTDKFLERMLILAGQLRKNNTDTCAVGLPVKGFLHDKPMLFGILWLVYDRPWSKIKKKEEPIIQSLLSNILYPIAGKLQTLLLSYQTRKRLAAEIRSASSAIMSRNMSHHIGSHVIPRTTNDLLKKKLIKFFFKGSEPTLVPEWRMLVGMLSDVKNLLDDYMCRKAEFIADVTTGPTLSSRSASFFGDVVLPFIQNTALIDTLAANEGFGYPAWNVSSLIIRCRKKSIKDEKDDIKFFPQFSNPDYGSVEKIGNNDQPIAPYAGRSLNDRTTVLVPSYKNKEFDMRVALPGSVGEMAFYSILENIIRNAAKYSGVTSLGNTDKKLEVNIVISDPQDEPETYRVDIYENLSNPEQEVNIDIKDGNEPKTLVELLQYYVTLDIIDNQGQLRKEAWGIAEIVINACHLRGCSAPDPKSLKISGLPLSELSGSHVADSDQKRLVYTLHLMKVKTALLVGFNDVAKGVREQLKDEGFIFIPNLEDVDEFISNRANSLASFQFAVVSSALLKKNNLEPLHEIRHRFPFRIIITGIDSSQQSLKSDRYALTDQTPAIENGNDLLIWLWETWLTKRWCLSQEEEKTTLSKYGIDLYLQQEQDVLPTKSWVKKAYEFNKRCREKKLSCGLRIWGRKSGEQAVCFTKIKKQPFYRRFILDRHRNFALNKDDPPKEIDNYVILDKSNTDFETLFSSSFTDPFTLPYELLEAGLLRILLLDERIAQKSMAALTDMETSTGTVKEVLIGNDKEGLSPVFWHMANMANIFVATHLILKKADDVLLELELAEDAYRANLANFQIKRKSSASKQSCPSLKLIVDTSKNPSVICEVEKIGQVVEKSHEILTDFDMVIIHQGILDRINQQINMEDNFLNQLKKTIPWLVIESGRGTPPKLSKDHKFVPFSIIERAFHRERIAKLGLTRTLMELSRNK